MKKLTVILVALLSVTFAFGQMKNQPEVVVVFLGEQNPTLNVSDFPDLNFYSTPNLKLKISEKASSNTNKKAWSSALGVGRTAAAEGLDAYTGTPAVLVDHNVTSGKGFLFDTDGVINAKLNQGESADFNKATEFLVKFNKLQRSWEQERFDDLMKELTKKGTTVKPDKKGKKDKKEDAQYGVGTPIDDFEVVSASGETTSIHSLVKGNTGTLLLFLRVNPEYDLVAGKESGAGKKGKDYANEVAQTMAAEKQIAPLHRLEKGIFGVK